MAIARDGLGVAVGVGDGVTVGVGVGDGVGDGVAVGDGVDVGVDVAVGVGAGSSKKQATSSSRVDTIPTSSSFFRIPTS